MTRIVAGRFGGRRIEVPASGVRPTSDRVREAIFSTLGHELGTWRGVHVLDLFAGSGGLGLEAVSRGAAAAVFVERDRRVAAVLRRNIVSLGCDTCDVVVADVRSLPRPAAEQAPAALVLADPPYSTRPERLAPALRRAVVSGWVRPGATFVVETDGGHDEAPFPAEVSVTARKDYGGTRVWYGRAQTALPAIEEE